MGNEPMHEETDYSSLITRWTERRLDEQSDDRIRQVALEAADERIILFSALGASVWAAKQYGWPAVAIIVPVAILLWWENGLGSTPNRYELTAKAENIVRFQIIAEAFAAGEAVWKLDTAEGSEKCAIYPVDNERWSGFWKRAYETALALEKLGPRGRRNRVVRARKVAREALRQGRELARREGVEMVFWAY